MSTGMKIWKDKHTVSSYYVLQKSQWNISRNLLHVDIKWKILPMQMQQLKYAFNIFVELIPNEGY